MVGWRMGELRRGQLAVTPLSVHRSLAAVLWCCVRTKVFAYTSGLSLASGSAAAGLLAMTKSTAAPALADGQQRAIDELNLSTNTNLAMAYLKTDNPDKAIYFANKVSQPVINQPLLHRSHPLTHSLTQRTAH